MSNRISVVIDVAVDRANTALGNFRKSVADADTATGKFKAGAASAFASLKANAGVAAVAAGGALVAFGAKAVAAASDLEESTNAVSKSFGKTADDVLEVGENAAESFGLSQAAFNAAAVSFAAFAKTVAGPGGDVANVIEDLTTRAADFASVMNIDVAEASTVFRSGLSGETEPLKKFGIDLSAAAVEAYALSEGLVANKKDMTEAIKVQARYGLLMQSTGQFAGDFADTSDGLANSSRILSATMTDLSAKIGKQLTPSIAVAVGYAIDLLNVIEALTKIPSTPLPGVSDESLRSWADFNELQQAAAGGNEKAQEAFRNGGKELSLLDEALGSTSDAARRYEEDVSRLNDAELIKAATTKESTKAVEDATKAAEDQQRAQEQTNRSIREAQRAVNDLMSAQLSAIDSNLGYRNAQADAAAALLAYDEAARAGELSTSELDAAARDAEGSALAQAAAAVQLAEDQAAANGSSLTAIERNNLFKQELEALAAYATGPLKVALEDYIATLGRIPKSVSTSVGFSRGPSGAIAGYRAKGGPVNAGGAYVVGEDGPELLQMGSQSGNVIPNGATVGVGGMSSGPNITINMPPGSDGDSVVRALRQYARRNGPIQGIT